MKEKNFSIGIDIDGTLTDTSPIYCGYVESKYGVIIKAENLDNYEKMSPVYGKTYLDLYEEFTKKYPEALFSVPPLINAVKSVNMLYEMANIKIMTARSSYLRKGTKNWLNKHGFKFNELYVEYKLKKSEIGVDILIEDNIETINKFLCKNPTKNAIIMINDGNRKQAWYEYGMVFGYFCSTKKYKKEKEKWDRVKFCNNWKEVMYIINEIIPKSI